MLKTKPSIFTMGKYMLQCFARTHSKIHIHSKCLCFHIPIFSCTMIATCTISDWYVTYHSNSQIVIFSAIFWGDSLISIYKMIQSGRTLFILLRILLVFFSSSIGRLDYKRFQSQMKAILWDKKHKTNLYFSLGEYWLSHHFSYFWYSSNSVRYKV